MKPEYNCKTVDVKPIGDTNSWTGTVVVEPKDSEHGGGKRINVTVNSLTDLINRFKVEKP